MIFDDFSAVPEEVALLNAELAAMRDERQKLVATAQTQILIL
jgi:hypothetical protein